jgi:protein-S-isoprenylcysteine O-methyltransferase Ste14
VSTFLIDHFELFGLRQVVVHAMGHQCEPPRFRERALYRMVRHPLMLGFLVAFWATPHMTWGHLLFAGMCTGYILVALHIEERTLVELHGARYQDYRRRVPMLLPLPRRRA